MPIPKKPGELREMIRARLGDMLVGVVDPRVSDNLTEAVMHAIAEYDPCFAKAAEAGEPTFTLRAQDRIAPGTLMDWVTWGQGYDVHANKLGAARRIAHAMRAWPNRRLPD